MPQSSVSADGGTNWMYYIYNRRLNAAARGLTYDVVAGTDLVFGNITNATEEVGSSAIDADFESVTNRISTAVESKQFMKLNVELTE